jgi:hypothetical protein
MTPEEFWALIDTSYAESDAEFEVGVARLIGALAARGQRVIAQFETRLQAETEALNIAELRAVAEQLWVLNDESWRNLRAWCVSRGRDFGVALRQKPARLAAVAAKRRGPFDPPNGELFLFCPDYARVSGVALPVKS